LADQWIKALARTQPEAIATIAFQAQSMIRKGDQAGAAALVGSAVNRLVTNAGSDVNTDVLAVVGGLYSTVEDLENAEMSYRKIYEQRNSAFEPYVRILERRGNFETVFSVLRHCLEDTESSISAALVGISIVANHTLNSDAQSSADELIRIASAKHGTDARFLSALATLRVVQGRSEEAIELYRTVVSDQPRDVVALNNLAALLSESAVTRADALKMIDRAIEIAGGAPELFDTKGTILVFDNKSGEAVDFLKAAIAAGNGDPRHRFHLALAYKDLDSLEQARGELQKALASDLDKQILTPTERKLLDEIRGIVAP